MTTEEQQHNQLPQRYANKLIKSFKHTETKTKLWLLWLSVQTVKKKIQNQPKHGNTDNSPFKLTLVATVKHNTATTSTKTENTASL